MEELKYNNFSYCIIDDAYIEIYNYTGSETDIAIPLEIENFPVKKISGLRFKNFNSVDFQGGSFIIEDYCFQNSNIKNIFNYQNIESIGNYAFENNSIGIENFTLGDKLSFIGDYSFANNNLSGKLTLGRNIETLGEGTFLKNKISSVDFSSSKVLVLPADIFKDNVIENVISNGMVRFIKGGAFYNNNLTSIDSLLTSELKEIGPYSFAKNNITSFESNVLNQELTSIGRFAFFENKISNFSLYNFSNLEKLDENCFDTNNITKEKLYNNSLKYIKLNAFKNNPGITDENFTSSGVGLTIVKYANSGLSNEDNINTQIIYKDEFKIEETNETLTYIGIDGLEKTLSFSGNVITGYYGNKKNIFFPSSVVSGSQVKNIIGIGKNKNTPIEFEWGNIKNNIDNIDFGDNIRFIILNGEGFKNLKKLNTKKIQFLIGNIFNNNELNKVELPEVLFLSERYFKNGNITEVNLSKLYSVNNEAFMNNNIRRLRFYQHLKEIKDSAFENNEINGTLDFVGTGIKYIGNKSFKNNFIGQIMCVNSVVRIDNLEFIGVDAFYKNIGTGENKKVLLLNNPTEGISFVNNDKNVYIGKKKEIALNNGNIISFLINENTYTKDEVKKVLGTNQEEEILKYFYKNGSEDYFSRDAVLLKYSYTNINNQNDFYGLGKTLNIRSLLKEILSDTDSSYYNITSIGSGFLYGGFGLNQAEDNKFINFNLEGVRCIFGSEKETYRITELTIPNSLLFNEKYFFSKSDILNINISNSNELFFRYGSLYRNNNNNNNNNLNEIIFPKNINYIQEDFFCNRKVEKIVIDSDSLLYIGKNSFGKCNFKELFLKGNENLIIDSGAFNFGRYKKIIIEKAGYILNNVFYGNYYLDKIKIPDSLKMIDSSSFYSNNNSKIEFIFTDNSSLKGKLRIIKIKCIGKLNVPKGVKEINIENNFLDSIMLKEGNEVIENDNIEYSFLYIPNTLYKIKGLYHYSYSGSYSKTKNLSGISFLKGGRGLSYFRNSRSNIGSLLTQNSIYHKGNSDNPKDCFNDNDLFPQKNKKKITENYIYFIKNNKSYIIKSFSNIIPNTVDGKQLDSIGHSSFIRLKIKGEVNLGNINIGEFAFSGSENKKEVDIFLPDYINKKDCLSNKIKSIIYSGNCISCGAFMFNNIEKIDIGTNDILGLEGAFIGNNISNLNVSNPVLQKTIGIFMYNNIKNILPGNDNFGQASFYGNLLENIEIGGNIHSKKIGDYCFANNKIKKVVLKNNIKEVSRFAFKNNKIEKLCLNNNIHSILEGAFMNNNLKDVVIPNTVIKMEENSFAGNKIKKIILPNTSSFIMDFNFLGNQLNEYNLNTIDTFFLNYGTNKIDALERSITIYTGKNSIKQYIDNLQSEYITCILIDNYNEIEHTPFANIEWYNNNIYRGDNERHSLIENCIEKINQETDVISSNNIRFFIGGKPVLKIFVGGRPVKKVYIGDVEIFNNI